MEVVYFTLVAIALYLIADRILTGIERTRGRPFEARMIVFFVILLSLALIVFPVLRRFADS